MINNVNQSQRLVKHIIRSFARLAENHRVRSILKQNLPPILKEKSFQMSLDESSRRWLQNIYKHLNSTYVSSRSNSENQKLENQMLGSMRLGSQNNFNQSNKGFELDYKGSFNDNLNNNFSEPNAKDDDYFESQ